MIYLDNSATTKPHEEVIKSFTQVNEQFFGNPSSLHELGMKAEQLLMMARKQVGAGLEVGEDEIVFTSGGTEGNNLAIKGIALQHQARGKHIITTQIEHSSVKEACSSLEQLGFEITYLNVDELGRICLKELQDKIREDTILVSVIHVNSEIGVVQNITEIGELLQNYPKLYFHVDHVQGFGKVALDLKKAAVDLCTVSGHKIHGLKGTGALYIRSGIRLFSLFHGGSQELGYRAGTENVAGAVAFAKAVRLMKEAEKNINQLQLMRDDLIAKLTELDYVEVNTVADMSAPHIINFSIPGLKPETLIHTLGAKDIYISTKSACSSKEHTPSEILLACNKSEAVALSALRVSLSHTNTQAELDTFLIELKAAIEKLKKVLG